MANTTLDCTRIAASLRPLDNETHAPHSARDSITNVLLHNQSLVRVARTVPAGSFAKGTALRDNWELDMVYLSPDVSSWNLASIHRQITDLLEKNFPEVRVTPRNHSLELQVKRGAHAVRCDVLIGRETTFPLQTAQVRDKELFQGTTAIWHKGYVGHCVSSASCR